MSTIPDEVCGDDYVMDPATVDLLPDGTYLREGMVVLSDWSRWDGKTNRWARVTHLRRPGHLVSFIAVYADGTKTKRSYASDYAWFVRLDSVAAEPEVPAADPEAVTDLVRLAYRAVVALTDTPILAADLRAAADRVDADTTGVDT